MTAETELPSMLAPPAAAERRRDLDRKLTDVRQRLARIYLVITSAAFALFWLVLIWVPATPAELAPSQAQVAAVCGAVAALQALVAWLSWRREYLAVIVCSLSSVLAVGVAAVGLGWGVAAPSIAFAAFHAALSMALCGWRVGVLVTGSALLMVWAVALAQAGGWMATAVHMNAQALVVLVQSLHIALAGAAGWLASRFVVRFMRTATEREHRFQSLLRIAVDAYWEMDPHYVLKALDTGAGTAPSASAGGLIGRVPWELDEFVCDPECLDQLQADLGARQPIHDVPVEWVRGGRRRHLLISGEPRFSARGVFRGYWGVVRDVTQDQMARAALAQTESRYQGLFTSIPTPLVLHQSGRILEANPAAVALFGFPDEDAMQGCDLLSFCKDDSTRDVARTRMRHLLARPTGENTSVAEFQLITRQGRQITVRTTGVVIEVGQARAVLSIFVDDTDRQAAEDAVRRSEALLSHLVASSPDVITLTDTRTGRYAMVNRSFERITGWSADEVVGRTSTDIAIWPHPEDRDRLLAQIRDQGRVQDMPVTFRRRDGSTTPLLVSGARFGMDRVEYLVLNARDMSDIERSRLEREAILDNASVGIALTRDQTFLVSNPAFDAMLGWPDGSIIGQPGSVVWPSEEAYADMGRLVGPALSRGEQIEVECEVCRRDGSTFLCRMLARAVDPSHPSRGGTIWVVEDITERHRLTEALAKARDDAEAANRAKSAFLANTSHELRTPLNGLVGLAQLARTPGLDSQRRERYLDLISESAQGLSMIVSDILDLAKIEAGRMVVEQAPFDLGDVLRSLERSQGAIAAMQGLDLVTETAPEVGTVIGDALRLRQILTNFLSNAIKFTAQGGVRLVVKRTAAEQIRFEVHDTGPGIDAATQARLFAPFTQADDTTTRRYGGTGLGLSICRQLAQAMGGQVGVHSAPGRGSCFWVELPLPVVDPASLPQRPMADLSSAQGAHVLMVDDNEVNMMVAVAQLEQFGVRVGQAVDGRQALESVAQAEAAGDPYDLVMMDLQMPVLSGCEVTQALRRRFAPDRLPIVAYTAAALVSEREAALAAGMNDFLSKPSDGQQLGAMVARWVQR